MKLYEQHSWGVIENSLCGLQQLGVEKPCEEASFSSLETHMYIYACNYLAYFPARGLSFPIHTGPVQAHEVIHALLKLLAPILRDQYIFLSNHG